MENFILDHDINVFCVTAMSFPDGIMDAYNKLHALVPDSKNRRIFGLSRPDERGTIIYKAAAEETFEGEAAKPGCEEFVIESGTYTSLVIHDFMKDLPGIGRAFTALLTTPGIDPNGLCVEWYLDDSDVRCMVRLA